MQDTPRGTFGEVLHDLGVALVFEMHPHEDEDTGGGMTPIRLAADGSFFPIDVAIRMMVALRITLIMTCIAYLPVQPDIKWKNRQICLLSIF